MHRMGPPQNGMTFEVAFEKIDEALTRDKLDQKTLSDLKGMVSDISGCVTKDMQGEIIDNIRHARYEALSDNHVLARLLVIATANLMRDSRLSCENCLNEKCDDRDPDVSVEMVRQRWSDVQAKRAKK